MTVTETRPEADQTVADEDTNDALRVAGLAGVLGTGDHKALGRLYVLFGLLGGLLSLVLGAMIRLERADLSGLDIFTFGSGNQYFQVWSLARTGLLFFCVLPLLIGLATYVVPLQVGAPSIAFPRAAAAAFWTWLVAIFIHVVTVFIDGGLGYPTLAQNEQFGALGPDKDATELSVLSIALVVIALMLATICVVTTVIGQRPEGMTLFETPLFSWSMLVAGGIWLLALPVWLANLAIAWVDFRGVDAVRYGNVRELWDQLGWLWSQPMIFAFVIPVLGIVGDIVPVAAGTRQRRYGLQQAAIGAFGVLSFGAFAQPYFSPDVADQAVFVVMSILIALATLAFLGGLADTLMAGKPKFSGHLVLGMFAILTLLLAVAAAVLRVSGAAVGAVHEIDKSWLTKVIDWLDEFRGTVIATGVLDLVLAAGLIGAVAGLYYWAPKIFGRQLSGPVGGLVGLSLLGGAALSGGSNVVNGMLDEGDHVFEASAYDRVWDVDAVELLNIIGFIGSILLIAGVALVFLDLAVAIGLGKGKADASDDPWDGHTLEWATDSPPPVGNFAAAPVVRSERPLLDDKERDA